MWKYSFKAISCFLTNQNDLVDMAMSSIRQFIVSSSHRKNLGDAERDIFVPEKCKVLELEQNSGLVVGHCTPTCYQKASKPNQGTWKECENSEKCMEWSCRKSWLAAAKDILIFFCVINFVLVSKRHVPFPFLFQAFLICSLSGCHESQLASRNKTQKLWKNSLWLGGGSS